MSIKKGLSMAWTALVPRRTRELFRQQGPADVLLVFYGTRREGLVRKFFRKTGLFSPEQSLRWRLDIDGGFEQLSACQAIWLPRSVWFPHEEMRLMLERMTNLKWVYSQVTGTEHLDLQSFHRRGAMLSTAGRLSSRRVAEMALACILAHAKRLPQLFVLQRARRWRSLTCNDIA